MIKAGIVGCGNIGAELAEHIVEKLSAGMTLAGVFDTNKEKETALADRAGIARRFADAEELIREVDLVIETASPACLIELFPLVLRHHKNLFILSPGALIHHMEYLEEARRLGVRVTIPSGAIGGIDALKAASLSEIKSVTLTTRKPPRGLEGAPYVVKNNIDLSRIVSETVIFEGSVAQAVEAFPKNINVSATLSLAGIGAERTRVRIVTSPGYRTNTHEIAFEGLFGRVSVRCENLPCAKNPRTSFLSILSAKALLGEMISPLRVGN